MKNKKINIIIPCLNEEKRLVNTLKDYNEFLKIPFAKQHHFKLYIIDDGSTDNTAKVANHNITKFQIDGVVISYDKRRGKGYAVKYGMLNSSQADYYYMADSDGAAGWESLEKLYNNLPANKVGCVIGSRYTSDAMVKNTLIRKTFGKFSQLLTMLILGINVQDTQCGYKLFSKECLEAFKLQTIEQWGFDFEILFLLQKMNFSIVEVGIKWKSIEDSRLKPIDYYKTLKELIKVRLTKYNSIN